MHLFSSSGTIKKYNTIKDIMMEFYEKRLELYEKRREYQLDQLKKALELISYKVKFILMVVEKKLIINNRKKKDIEVDLEKHKFPKLGEPVSYNYLLSLPIYNLTYEKIEELKKQEKDKQSEYDTLLSLSSSDIWKTELQELLELL